MKTAAALLALSLALAPRAAAQSAAPAAPSLPDAPNPELQQGLAEGAVAAQAVGTGVWTVSGLAGGVLLGPLGTGLFHAMAGNSASAPPPAVAKKLAKRSPDYQLGYQQAFTERLARRRKHSVLAGGYVGSVLFIGTAYLAAKKLRGSE